MNQVNSELSPQPQVVVDVGWPGPHVPPQHYGQHQVGAPGHDQGTRPTVGDDRSAGLRPVGVCLRRISRRQLT